MNHAVMCVESLLIRDSELVFHYLVEYNFFFKFLQFMEELRVKNFFISLLLLQGTSPLLPLEVNEKVSACEYECGSNNDVSLAVGIRVGDELLLRTHRSTVVQRTQRVCVDEGENQGID